MSGDTYSIDCSNLHVGGGVQVACSFVNELQNSFDGDFSLSIIASAEVVRHLHRKSFDAPFAFPIQVVDTFGWRPLSRGAREYTNKHTRVFTVFGPLYRWRTPFKSIVGFAQPWIIYPDNECYARLPLLRRLPTRLKFKVQSIFFKRADELVVELEHVKEGLIRELGIAPERIHVVHNCLSSLYADETSWRPVSIPPSKGALRLGFVGRNYSHKNTAIFPDMIRALKNQHSIDARCYVTFTEAEWRACTPEFRKVCVNVGPLDVDQCPTFYRAMDGIVFPSLLECFSATPLEAMAMERPLFASDRLFNTEICGEHAWYFDPMAPETAADCIASAFGGSGPDHEALRRAREHAISFASPKERAQRYLEILRS
ncbi:MAG TPA: glycosyltransferase family 4 protein [Croceibacterium sp.]|nr:glycosyltransferase family 4 protein [Croceibacterium sp.]